MTRQERNSRAVELWLQSNSWRAIASQLADEGFGSVSHQYIARVVKRELSKAWDNSSQPPSQLRPQLQRALREIPASPWHEPEQADEDMSFADSLERPAYSVPLIDPVDEEPRPGPVVITEVVVESFFNARHFVIINDSTGHPHHHSYRVRVNAAGGIDPATGIVVGFAETQAALDAAVTPFADEFLNRLEEFSEAQPTTENLAISIAESVRDDLGRYGLRVTSMTLWESPTKGVTVTLSPVHAPPRPAASEPATTSEIGHEPFISA